jgi:hypothetical protein
MPLRPKLDPSRLLLTNARPEAFAPHARSILARLGYAIVTGAEMESLACAPEAASGMRSQVDMLISDEMRLADVPDTGGEDPIPVILLTGRHGIREQDSRVVAAVKRPAGLHDLYRIIQQYFEEMPRSTPRVATRIPVSCRQGGAQWDASVVSLSENGCLMRFEEPVRLGSKLKASMHLPHFGAVELEAEIAYQLVPDFGLIFNAIPARVRNLLRSYVVETLMPAAGSA